MSVLMSLIVFNLHIAVDIIEIMLLQFRHTVHPVHIRYYSSMNPRYTVHPVHIRYYSSMNPRYTVHPVHKKVLAFARTFYYFLTD